MSDPAEGSVVIVPTIAGSGGFNIKSPDEADDKSFADSSYFKPQMKIFGVIESDLDNLASIGVRLNLFLAAATAFASFAASSFLAGLFADEKAMSGEALAMYHYGTPTLLFAAIIFGFLTHHEIKSKNTLHNKVKTNVKIVENI